MDRLIKRIGHGIVMPKSMQLAMERLASYEDTGLEPDEIPHWIPCREKMPNPKDMKNITVLTCRKSTITGRPVVLDIARWNGAGWMCKGKELANVTHWQPLPAPPKGEKP